MYKGEPGEIRTDAYHGTNLTSALSILESGFIPHLGIAGVGVYFDLGDDSSANERALEKADGDISQAVIIRAEVHLGKTIEFNFSSQKSPSDSLNQEGMNATISPQIKTPAISVTFPLQNIISI